MINLKELKDSQPTARESLGFSNSQLMLIKQILYAFWETSWGKNIFCYIQDHCFYAENVRFTKSALEFVANIFYDRMRKFSGSRIKVYKSACKIYYECHRQLFEIRKEHQMG